MTIQRMFWGLMGRKRSKERRNEVANERLEAARVQAVKERKAIMIQCMWHIHIARGVMTRKKAELRVRRIRESLEDRMARIIQRIERGRVGRKLAAYVRYLKEMEALRFTMAKFIQRVYRGHVGRLIAAEERRLREIRIRNEKALIIQCFWRTLRAKMIVAILRALRILREKQFKNARMIQRVYRGYRARVMLLQKRAEMEARLRVILASIKIQRLFRGHKGREIAEVERALKNSEAQAKPLYALLRDLEEEGTPILHTHFVSFSLTLTSFLFTSTFSNFILISFVLSFLVLLLLITTRTTNKQHFNLWYVCIALVCV